MSLLLDFLGRNSIDRDKPLPLVHTCEAIVLKRILREMEIKASPCNVFVGESLLYFFVGRPAYKKEVTLEPHYWELPVCIICEYDVAGAKYIYPFDTGGFAKGVYPNFISGTPMSEFDISSDPSSIGKIIGTFFANRISYFQTKPRSEDEFVNKYSIDVLDEEIRALHALITTRMPKTPDDRRASIEVAFNTSFDLHKRKVLAVVLPEIYLESAELMRYIEVDLQAEPISYPILRQNVNYYYSCIYMLVEQFYHRRNCFRV